MPAPYIGETGRPIGKRLEEHKRCAWLFQSERSQMSAHCLDKNHNMDWNKMPLTGQRVTLEKAEDQGGYLYADSSKSFQLHAIWNQAILHQFEKST